MSEWGSDLKVVLFKIELDETFALFIDFVFPDGIGQRDIDKNLQRHKKTG